MQSRTFLYISLAADIGIAVSKFIGAGITRSSSMMAEAIHSVIDAVSQLLLIWGVKSSQRPADASHPLGYGRELYYWSLIVSLVIFILGGCISFYQGLLKVQHPQVEGSPVWNYTVLAITFVFNTVSLRSAYKAFNAKRTERSFWKALVRTKDPSTMIVLLGDIGDLLGLLIAFLGIWLGRLYHEPILDGYASMLIGLLLIVISGFLIRESKSLLLGEPISKQTKAGIITRVEKDPAINKVTDVLSIYRSPEDALVVLHARFDDRLTMPALKEAMERITRDIQTTYPAIRQVLIAPE